MARKKKPKKLSTWDWETLVASWRYYEHRHTIASSMFPAAIIERFWNPLDPYDKEEQRRIAHQFALVDHYSRGEEDWPLEGSLNDCDARPWRKFYGFCRAFAQDYFETAYGLVDGHDVEIKCFRANGRIYPVDRYIRNPYFECYCDESMLKRKSKKKRKLNRTNDA